LYRSAWPESSREASERFLMETLGRTQSERPRRLGLAGGFRLLRSSSAISAVEAGGRGGDVAGPVADFPGVFAARLLVAIVVSSLSLPVPDAAGAVIPGRPWQASAPS
jgi:hypothetical protein